MSNFASILFDFDPRERLVIQTDAKLLTVRTEVRFVSLLSGGFITMAVINPQEKKTEKR